ncbi:MAG TPA: hypothetical protein ENO14_04850, partial [Chromatiales bacterium]|nr:hypothetical protein [Chromatiales bacterium]
MASTPFGGLRGYKRGARTGPADARHASVHENGAGRIPFLERLAAAGVAVYIRPGGRLNYNRVFYFWQGSTMPIKMIREFLRLQSAGGAMLAGAAALALLAANIPFIAPWYRSLLEVPIEIRIGALHLDKN